uniref:Uncharacterized protein n=1 Tax=Ditylenchus dipsaci TaxID=166011 RepID=A0A915E1V1_9BILA
MKCSLQNKGSRKGQICPAGYLCLENSHGGVCCPRPETDVCALSHSEPYVVSAQQYPMTCSIETKNLKSPQKSQFKTCPTAFDCFQYKSFAIGFCCQIYYPQHHPTSTLAPPFVLDQKVEACENGDQPYKNAAGQVRRCSLQVEVEYGDDDERMEFETPPYCPKQYKCEFNSGLYRFQCCPDVSPISMKEKDYAVFETTQSRPKETCPPGWVVALNSKTNQPIFCRKNTNEDCPADSRCVYNSAYARFVCCV